MLTNISVRTLHYYDEIGLLRPSRVTESGYRLYDDDALSALQQILFFRELDFSLKDIRAIMLDPAFDKGRAFVLQKALIEEKRRRLDGLISLLDRLIEGEQSMNFEAFDMKDYTEALEVFLHTRADEFQEHGGDLEEMNRVLDVLKSDSPEKAEIAKMAIQQYGSIEKYTEAMKQNIDRFPELMEQMQAKKEQALASAAQSKALMRRLTEDLTRDVASDAVQQIVAELIATGDGYTEDIGMDQGEHYWDMMADWYLTHETLIEATDKEYGSGAAAFIGKALKARRNGGK